MAVNLRFMLRGALLTALTLFGGILVGGLTGNLIFENLSGHSLASPNSVHVILAIIPAAIGLIVGSAAWGWSMAGLAEEQNRRRMALAGLLGFTPIVIILAVVLLNLEGIIVENTRIRLPLNRLFTVLFVPSAFLIAGFSSWVLGRGLMDKSLANSLFWRVGLVSAIAFLAVNLVMEASGWIVGAPNAAERFTMLTVMLAGNFAAALSGGAVLGWTLAKRGDSGDQTAEGIVRGGQPGSFQP